MSTYLYPVLMFKLCDAGGTGGQESTSQCRTQEIRVGALGQEDPLEKAVAPHSNILAWEIP